VEAALRSLLLPDGPAGATQRGGAEACKALARAFADRRSPKERALADRADRLAKERAREDRAKGVQGAVSAKVQDALQGGVVGRIRPLASALAAHVGALPELLRTGLPVPPLGRGGGGSTSGSRGLAKSASSPAAAPTNPIQADSSAATATAAVAAAAAGVSEAEACVPSHRRCCGEVLAEMDRALSTGHWLLVERLASRLAVWLDLLAAAAALVAGQQHQHQHQQLSAALGLFYPPDVEVAVHLAVRPPPPAPAPAALTERDRILAAKAAARAQRAAEKAADKAGVARSGSSGGARSGGGGGGGSAETSVSGADAATTVPTTTAGDGGVQLGAIFEFDPAVGAVFVRAFLPHSSDGAAGPPSTALLEASGVRPGAVLAAIDGVNLVRRTAVAVSHMLRGPFCALLFTYFFFRVRASLC